MEVSLLVERVASTSRPQQPSLLLLPPRASQLLLPPRANQLLLPPKLSQQLSRDNSLDVWNIR